MTDHLHAPDDEQPAPPFGLGRIVAAAVFQPSLGGAAVFAPLLFQMDESPLPPTEAEMLDAGHQQVIVRVVHQQNLLQVTPSGSSSATVTQ